MAQNATQIQRAVMEMEEEPGHVWYYAQYVQKDRALMELLIYSYLKLYLSNIQSSHTRSEPQLLEMKF